MSVPNFPEWADRFVLSRELTPSEKGIVYRRVARGDLIRVGPGAFLPSDLWDSLQHESRHLWAVRGAALVARSPEVFSHQSAAVHWRLPLLEPPVSPAHVTVPPAAGGRSTRSLERHSTARPVEPVQIDGLQVTSLARTAVDIAATCSFEAAVITVDAALRRTNFPLPGIPRTFVDHEILWAEQQLLPLRHGSASTARVIEFADARAQLPGESLSRVSMWRAGTPKPILQQELAGASGRLYTVDFYWPHARLIGEFDGAAKYSDPAFLAGRTPEQALLEEKEREDDLRRAGYAICRWRWATARDPRALLARLRGAGL